MPSLELQKALLFGVPIVLSASTLAWMHWFPWHNGTKELERVTAYTLGTAVVVGFPIIAMLVADGMHLAQDERFWALLLFINTFVSGATVRAAYWIDSHKAVTPEEVKRDAGL